MTRPIGSRVSEAASLLNIATECQSKTEYRREALCWLDRVIGFDVALFGRVHDPLVDTAITTKGMDGKHLVLLQMYHPRYVPDLMRYVHAALAHGPFLDTEYFGKELERMPLYDEVCRYHGARLMLTAMLTAGGSVGAGLCFGRAAPGARFNKREIQTLRRALPLLSLGDAVRRRSPDTSAWIGVFTARERQVLEYLCLGFGNAQIGVALGSSANTVRNQVAAILRKTGTKKRAELVRLYLTGKTPPT